ncbi:hypothetical protein [Amycolatopsis sp. lyj-112]|uniref:hypothetical protein n=1 Tax=Amycolatopsis sp. lyj-112 TaxID=2789288 RepID=UPI00397D91F6
MGYELGETRRAERDAKYDTALRTGEYPLRYWDGGWNRARAQAFLRETLEIETWVKSACTYHLLTALLPCPDWTESPPVHTRSVLRPSVSRLYVPRREDDLVRGSGSGVVGRRSETGHARRVTPSGVGGQGTAQRLRCTTL